MFLILPGKIQTAASISWDIDFWQGGPEKKISLSTCLIKGTPSSVACVGLFIHK